jgi:hypothetical protein
MHAYLAQPRSPQAPPAGELVPTSFCADAVAELTVGAALVPVPSGIGRSNALSCGNAHRGNLGPGPPAGQAGAFASYPF